MISVRLDENAFFRLALASVVVVAHMPRCRHRTHVERLEHREKEHSEFYPSCRIKFYRRIATQTSSQPESRRPDALPYFLALMFLLLFNTLKRTFRYPSSLLYSLWAFYFCLLACGFKIFPSSSLPRLMLFLLLLFITRNGSFGTRALLVCLRPSIIFFQQSQAKSVTDRMC